MTLNEPTYDEILKWTYESIYKGMKGLHDDMLQECIKETNKRIAEQYANRRQRPFDYIRDSYGT